MEERKIIVGFVSLGCPKNLVDSERMLAEIAKAGLLITAEPEGADVVVINTCGFIAPAKAEAIEVIKEAAGWKAGGTVKKIVVAGCLPEREGAALFDETEGIDAVVGLGQRDAIAEIIKKTFYSGERGTYLEKRPEAIVDDRSRLLITPSHWAYLRISEGCDHRCSFCTIPAIRGRLRSKSQEMLIAEAAELAAAGAVELNIIAQDVTGYGRDLNIKDGLAGLLKELEKIEGVRWIRLMYLYPLGITEQLLETIAASRKIVHYFDIPIQHINDEILKAMRRPDTKEYICQLIERLRAALPDVVLRTTVIVGFPGESEGQFGELVEFIKWARFDALGCFRFYRENGTAAAEMGGQVPDEVKQRRYDEMMTTQQQIAFAKNKKRVGSTIDCLVDAVGRKKNGRGRYYGQAPDIDSVCIIQNCRSEAGEFVNAKVVGVKDYDLVVRQP